MYIRKIEILRNVHKFCSQYDIQNGLEIDFQDFLLPSNYNNVMKIYDIIIILRTKLRRKYKIQ